MATKIKFDSNGQCYWCRCLLLGQFVTDDKGRQYCREIHRDTHLRWEAEHPENTDG